MDLDDEELEATKRLKGLTKNKCDCCDDFEFLNEIYDGRVEFHSAIVSKSKHSTTQHGLYELNYCPKCR